MQTTNHPLNRVKLPVSLGKLVARDRITLPDNSFLVSVLSAAEIGLLKKLLKREIAPEGEVDYPKALTALARIEKSKEVCEILTGFLADESARPTDRAVAAVNLGLIALPDAQRGLLEHIYVKIPLVQVNIFQSLGQIGDAEALERLNRLHMPGAAFVSKQLAFAKTLIAYRHNLENAPLAFKPGKTRKPGPDEEVDGLTIEPASPRELGRVMASLRCSTYSIALSSRHGFTLTAGETQWALLINSLIEEDGIGFHFGRRKLIAGLLALHDDLTGSHSVEFVILTCPVEKGVEILVVRTDGEVEYVGRAKAAREGFEFSIGNVERPGTAPAALRGAFSTGGIRLQTSVLFANRANKRRAEPIRP